MHDATDGAARVLEIHEEAGCDVCLHTTLSEQGGRAEYQSESRRR